MCYTSLAAVDVEYFCFLFLEQLVSHIIGATWDMYVDTPVLLSAHRMLPDRHA